MTEKKQSSVIHSEREGGREVDFAWSGARSDIARASGLTEAAILAVWWWLWWRGELVGTAFLKVMFEGSGLRSRP